MMERQRSFSLMKHTRFLVFSFTISSSLIFLAGLSIWLINTAPSLHQETHFQFNKPSSLTTITDLKPSTTTVQTSFTGVGRDFSANQVSNSILLDAHFTSPENNSRFQSGTSQVSDDETVQRGNFTGFSAKLSTANDGGKITTLAGTHLINPENASSEFNSTSTDSIFKGLQRKQSESSSSQVSVIGSNFRIRQHNASEVSSHERNKRNCDVAKGKWVFDDNSYPLYTNGSCPFIDEGFNCQGNGRLDQGYIKWRWQPQDCTIPRFNATKMLELMRGKRIVFVGDSINRNQWESMLCLLMGAIKDPKRVYETHGRRITKEKGNYSFKFVDYQCTVEYYVTHFLVHESKARVGKKRVQTLRIDAIDRGSSRWRGADILVFNTAHWWTHYKTKAGINYYQERDQVHPRLDVLTAFQRALTTWALWVDKYINPRKTRVFFRSSSPSHFRGGLWNSGGHCREATQPLNETLFVNYPEKNIIVEEVLRKMKTPVTYLNITRLSEYRIDGHPSVYGRKSRNSYSSSIQDCSHWCLPGVPDIWNELLYFHLQLKSRESFAE
ncbi:protein trichome birefringence-like 6 [Cornus florida]|uniref:protein trichome birefringence-like 6 n=1 Tax=Cornus florida TaxID=4283 RepID=UPI002896BD59|nr:protein trichome birefringence-like 6 [Cornus florida]